MQQPVKIKIVCPPFLNSTAINKQTQKQPHKLQQHPFGTLLSFGAFKSGQQQLLPGFIRMFFEEFLCQTSHSFICKQSWHKIREKTGWLNGRATIQGGNLSRAGFQQWCFEMLNKRPQWKSPVGHGCTDRLLPCLRWASDTMASYPRRNS